MLVCLLKEQKNIPDLVSSFRVILSGQFKNHSYKVNHRDGQMASARYIRQHAGMSFNIYCVENWIDCPSNTRA